MTVAELIAKLQELPANEDIYVPNVEANGDDSADQYVIATEVSFEHGEAWIC